MDFGENYGIPHSKDALESSAQNSSFHFEKELTDKWESFRSSSYEVVLLVLGCQKSCRFWEINIVVGDGGRDWTRRD